MGVASETSRAMRYLVGRWCGPAALGKSGLDRREAVKLQCGSDRENAMTDAPACTMPDQRRTRPLGSDLDRGAIERIRGWVVPLCARNRMVSGWFRPAIRS